MKIGAFTRAALVAAAIGLLAPLAAHAQNAPLRTASLSLQPGDALQITVWPDASLSGEFRVEDTGIVYLPFLGGVQVAGMTIDQLRNQLRQGYGEIIKEPVVTIRPIFNIGVMGAVSRPGIYQIDPTTDILEAIMMAGGFGDRAKSEEIRIVRQNEVVEVDVQRALEEGGDLGALALRSGDRIIVPHRGGGIKARTVFEVFRTLTTTALLVERLVRN